MKFKAVVKKEPTGGYSAVVPALPGCITEGDTLKELKANLHEAITLWLESAQEINGAEGDRELSIAV